MSRQLFARLELVDMKMPPFWIEDTGAIMQSLVPERAEAVWMGSIAAKPNRGLCHQAHATLRN